MFKEGGRQKKSTLLGGHPRRKANPGVEKFSGRRQEGKMILYPIGTAAVHWIYQASGVLRMERKSLSPLERVLFRRPNKPSRISNVDEDSVSTGSRPHRHFNVILELDGFGRYAHGGDICRRNCAGNPA